MILKKLIIQIGIALIISLLFIQGVEAQEDSIVKPVHSPKLATYMSMACPGLGQIYNQKYWKVPVIYAGFGVCAYIIATNQGFYKSYYNELKFRMDNGDKPKASDMLTLSDDNVIYYMNYYKRNRDLGIIVMGLIYMLNVVDATVDAHLFNFDVSENLSLNIQPNLIYYPSLATNVGGLNLKLTF